MSFIPGFFGKCFGTSKKQNIVYSAGIEDYRGSDGMNTNVKPFHGCSSCVDVSKLGKRNANRISELQHQIATLNKKLQLSYRKSPTD